MKNLKYFFDITKKKKNKKIINSKPVFDKMYFIFFLSNSKINNCE